VDGEAVGSRSRWSSGRATWRWHRRKRLGRVEFSGMIFFADGGPTDLGGGDIDAAGCEAEVPRDQQGAACKSGT
jgi:hypothetical protein